MPSWDALNVLENVTERGAEIQLLMGVLSDQLSQIVFPTVIIMSLPISLFGAVGNIITVVVYFRMSFSESTNVSLTALAISDLVITTTAIICVIPILLTLFEIRLPFVHNIFLPIIVHPHVLFTRVSAMITAYISVERYLCVSLPLKVKRMFTPRRALVAMLIIPFVICAPGMTIYWRYPLGWIYSPSLNRSILGILPLNSQLPIHVHNIATYYHSFLITLSSFGIVTTCTILLSVGLRRSQRWRAQNMTKTSSTTTTGAAGDNSRELNTIKMLIVIASVFIVSTIPSCIHSFVVMFLQGFDILGRYKNMYTLTGFLFLVIESLNCSANVIIYYRMSSKFRHALQSVILRKQVK